MAAFFFLILFAATCPDPVPFILAAVCHECAHILCAFFLGMGFPRPRLSGAWVRLEYRYDKSAAKRIFLCLSGSLSGIILGLLFWKFSAFSICSVSLGVINLLPLSCFDGGGVLREVCGILFLPDTAWRICRAVSVIFTLALWALSAAVQFKAGINYTLLFLSTVLIVSILSDSE